MTSEDIKENPIITRILTNFKTSNIDFFQNERITGFRHIQGIPDENITTEYIEGSICYGTRLFIEDNEIHIVPELQFSGNHHVEYYNDLNKLSKKTFNLQIDSFITETKIVDGCINLKNLMFFYDYDTKVMTIR